MPPAPRRPLSWGLITVLSAVVVGVVFGVVDLLASLGAFTPGPRYHAITRHPCGLVTAEQLGPYLPAAYAKDEDYDATIRGHTMATCRWDSTRDPSRRITLRVELLRGAGRQSAAAAAHALYSQDHRYSYQVRPLAGVGDEALVGRDTTSAWYKVVAESRTANRIVTVEYEATPALPVGTAETMAVGLLRTVAHGLRDSDF
ncbi:MAG: hypothetical protein ACJ73S_24295 [Mycobacteriales bacterium]